ETHDLPDDVVALLDIESVWAEDDLFEGAVASVIAEISAQSARIDLVQLGPASVTGLASRRHVQWGSALLGAAAALVLGVAALVVFRLVMAKTAAQTPSLSSLQPNLNPTRPGRQRSPQRPTARAFCCRRAACLLRRKGCTTKHGCELDPNLA
ncbi:MAG: hypothetical protein ACI8V4_003009, partial [Ilumatobacter sp.]